MNKKIHLLFLLLSSYAFSQTVVINELDADTPSTDLLEFVELKSATPNFSLNGYVLVFFNAGDANKSYLAFDLDGLTTDVNGIVTLGSAGLSPAPDRVINDNIIQNGPDAVALYQMNSAPASGFLPTTFNLLDAIIHKTNDADPTSLMTALGKTTAFDEGQNGNAAGESIQRMNDGSYLIKTPTPDVPNDGSGVAANKISVSFTPSGNLTEGTTFNLNFSTENAVTGNALVLEYTLANGTFSTADYSGGLTVTIPVGTKTATQTITLVDDVLNEGDETLKLVITSTIPNGYSLLNNNIEVRVHDNDYIVQPWGTPIAPTYGLAPRSIPNGYYDSLEGKSGLALKQAIQDIIANPAVVREHTYADVWDILKEADQDPRNSSNVWLMYVEHESSKLNRQTNTSGAVGYWNREHIFPQSRGMFGLDDSLPNDGIAVWLPTDANDIQAGGADAHHIRAEDSPENSSRSNRNYGVDYNGPSGNLGSWKGDVARAVFYMAVRYNDLDVVNANPSEGMGELGDLATLLVWNKQDKADDFEMNRNNVIYNWQKNRNPFIDYPVLADYVFGDKVGQTWSSTLASPKVSSLNISVYPNPSHGVLTLTGDFQELQLELINTTGQRVATSTYKSGEVLSLPYPKGIYLLKLSDGSKTETKKIVIN